MRIDFVINNRAGRFFNFRGSTNENNRFRAEVFLSAKELIPAVQITQLIDYFMN